MLREAHGVYVVMAAPAPPLKRPLRTDFTTAKVPISEFERTFVLKVDDDLALPKTAEARRTDDAVARGTQLQKETFALVLYTNSSLIKVFCGMGIDEEGKMFPDTDKNGDSLGVWFPSRKRLEGQTKRQFRDWKWERRVGFEGAKRFQLSEEYNLPVVAGYNSETQRIRFKGLGGDLTFGMYFTQPGQKERFEQRWS